MARAIPRDGRERVWKGVLAHLAAIKGNPAQFSAADLVDAFEDMGYSSAAQILKRLQTWGHIRQTGFEASSTGRGRRRKVYEVTDHGMRAARHHRERGGEDRA